MFIYFYNFYLFIEIIIFYKFLYFHNKYKQTIIIYDINIITFYKIKNTIPLIILIEIHLINNL
jgi:hypothetical protein